MSKLQPDFLELQAYVDGELDNIRASEIADLLSANPQLASQVSGIRELKQSVSNAINSLPQSDSEPFQLLAEPQVDSTDNTDFTKRSNENPTAAGKYSHVGSLEQTERPVTASDFDSEKQRAPRPKLSRPRHSVKTAGIALAAAIAGLLFGLTLSPTRQLPQDHTGWITQVASYHDMYTSATLAGVANSHPSDLENREMYEDAMGEALAIPDLSTLGFQFKRAQLLQSGKNPVVQFAYLDENTNTPLAFCITVTDSEGRNLQNGQSHGVNYINWSSSTLDYVVLGKLPHEQLQQMAMLTQAALP